MNNGFTQNPGRNVKGGGLYKTLKNWWGNAFSTTSQYRPAGNSGGIQSTPPSLPMYVPPGLGKQQVYQIKTGDTFEKLAQVNNTSVGAFQNVNNMTVPPPKGSYVQIPPQATAYGPTASKPPAPAFPGTGSFLSGSGAPNTGTYIPVLTTEEIMAQLQSGQVPAVIPFQASKNLLNPATGKPFTDKDYMADGYVYNNMKKQWELPAALAQQQAQGQAQQQTSAKPWEQIVNYNGKQVPAYVAQLMAKRAARKQRERMQAAQPTQQATNAGGLPQTTLDVQIGGG